MRKTLYIGVDPGKQGAISVLVANDGDTKTSDISVTARHVPLLVTTTKFARAKTKSGKPKVSRKTRYDVKAMYAWLKQAALKQINGLTVLFCIERQWPRPEDGKSQVQAFAEGYATWTTLARVLDLQIIEVSPTSWKPRYVPPGSDKNASKEVCKRIFPQLALPLVKDEALAEATLIADYVRRQRNGLPYERDTSRKLIKDGDKPTRRRKQRRGSKLSFTLKGLGHGRRR